MLSSRLLPFFPLASDVVVSGVCLSFTFHFQLTVLYFISAAFQPFIHSVAVRSRTVQVVFRYCCACPIRKLAFAFTKKILGRAFCRIRGTHIRISIVGRSSLNKKKEYLRHSSLEKVEWTNRRWFFWIFGVTNWNSKAAPERKGKSGIEKWLAFAVAQIKFVNLHWN